jgi:hypothetical protein
LPLPDPLIQNEIDACEELMAALIQHWAAIGAMTLDGLRGTFLLREGKLSLVDHGFELHIERKAFDILLEQLPWGIGTIRLGWLEEMVYVYW